MNLKEDNYNAHDTDNSQQRRKSGTGYRMERISGIGKYKEAQKEFDSPFLCAEGE